MAYLYYAVRKGKTRGLVNTWAECQEMIRGVSGAEFKGFNSEQDAYDYLDGKNVAKAVGNLLSKPEDSSTANVYARGSFLNGTTDIGIVLEGQTRTWKFYGEIVCNDFESARGFAGELIATMVAAQLCRDMGFTNVNIANAYDGAEKWYTGEWGARGSLQNEYLKCLTWLTRNAGINFSFTKCNKGSKGRWLSDAEKMITRSKEQRHYIDKMKTFMCQLAAKDVPLYSIS